MTVKITVQSNTLTESEILDGIKRLEKEKEDHKKLVHEKLSELTKLYNKHFNVSMASDLLWTGLFFTKDIDVLQNHINAFKNGNEPFNPKTIDDGIDLQMSLY